MTVITIPPNVKKLLELAASDYDSFLLSLSSRDRGLTKVLTCEHDYNAVFILDGVVWWLSWDEATNCFEVSKLAHESDLEVDELGHESDLWVLRKARLAS